MRAYMIPIGIAKGKARLELPTKMYLCYVKGIFRSKHCYTCFFDLIRALGITHKCLVYGVVEASLTHVAGQVVTVDW